ncbi:pseudouridine synthase [Rhodoferax sp.]|uniref:pseudouridine synthase n=1 Tax=Rhodoferax sp. TaxID=50421 RepID=UPI0025DB2038|nr:pseudouridine synthase [Rhodoferax sp.]
METSEPAGLDTLYADAHILVFNKPSGLLSVPGRGDDKQDCLSARAQRAYPDALVVHRLDMSTSGLIVMARGIAMQRLLNAAFAGREVAKRYTAVVAGRPDGEHGQIDLPILVDWPNRPLRKIDWEHGKPSCTRWRVLETMDGSTRLELEPVTGRSHQLRVHLAAIGHPILGDALYAPATVQAMAGRLLLHASSLALQHPATGVARHWDCAAAF